jgi:hypothetical protein
VSYVVDLGSERRGRGRRQADKAKRPGVEDACEEAGSKMAWLRSSSRVSRRVRNIADGGDLRASSSSNSFMASKVQVRWGMANTQTKLIGEKGKKDG